MQVEEGLCSRGKKQNEKELMKLKGCHTCITEERTCAVETSRRDMGMGTQE